MEDKRIKLFFGAIFFVYWVNMLVEKLIIVKNKIVRYEVCCFYDIVFGVDDGIVESWVCSQFEIIKVGIWDFILVKRCG